MSIIRRLRPLAAGLFVFIVVPGITAAASMLGFLAITTYLHSERHNRSEPDIGGRHMGDRAHLVEQGDAWSAP